MSDSPHSAIDSVARDKATMALQRIDSHEEICAERYENIIYTNRTIQTKIDSINKTNLKIAGTIIILLLSIVGVLITKVLHI